MTSPSQYYVYILTNKRRTVLYIGVTSDLIKRIYEHKEKLAAGFAKKHNLDQLVWFEATASVQAAIVREKQLKAGPRQKKLDLIQAKNPNWDDLYDALLG